jgi:hypothetical protein
MELTTLTEVSDYKIIPIRLKGTNKTENVDHTGKANGRKHVVKGNCVDPVRGCPGFHDPVHPQCAWDCYSEEAVRRFKKCFGHPISMELKEHLLRKDLRECPSDWIRVGVDGAPSWDWELTTKVAEIIASEDKVPLIITRIWKPIPAAICDRLVKIGAILNITVAATDAERGFRTRLAHYSYYRAIGGMVALRVVTFAFNESDGRWRIQNRLMTHYESVLEQPARIMRRTKNTKREVCAWDYVDQEKYHDYHSYITGKPNPRWRTAGQLYNVPACVKACPECENQCMVRIFTGGTRGDVLGRVEVIA